MSVYAKRHPMPRGTLLTSYTSWHIRLPSWPAKSITRDLMTDGDLRAVIDSANAATLANIAEELAENREPDELLANV
jgi:hypothetical protein